MEVYAIRATSMAEASVGGRRWVTVQHCLGWLQFSQPEAMEIHNSKHCCFSTDQ